MAKEGYKPTAGMQSAARRAIKLKEQGKAKGAGTIVGWTRAGQLARGETLSLSTVKRMYSFFSRHEVDKKGKDFNNAENPSNGKIMWLAWGGDAGFSWSRKIVNKEKNMKKSLEVQEVIEEIKDMLSDVVNPAETVVEISDDLEKSNAINIPMGEKVENNKVQKESEDIKEEDEDYESDNEEEDKWDNIAKSCWSGYEQQGMKDKGGRKVPNCVPIKKSVDEAPINEAEKEVKKSIWGGTFLK
jgi:rhodanese-related sulfurtransferase